MTVYKQNIYSEIFVSQLVSELGSPEYNPEVLHFEFTLS